MNRVQKRLLIIITVLILTVSVLTLVGSVFVTVFTKRNINFEYDEELFRLARGGSITEYYVDDDGIFISADDYNPVLNKSIALSENKKLWCGISEISDSVKSGFLAMEDRRFYEHSGIDIKRTVYALLNSVFHFKNTFGASTITQQVIKNISGDNELSLKRKLSEIIRASHLEKNHSKDEIFEIYLNIVPMGENLFGISAAAETYFGKEAKNLTLAEAATLVGITNAPTRYNPHISPERCIKKRNDVLFAMRDFGVISEKEYEAALKSELGVLDVKNKADEFSSWFVETVNSDVISALQKKYGITEASAKNLFYKGGLRIYTTENPTVQGTIEKYFENEKNFPSEISKGLEYSMVVCDSKSGNLLGIVGACGKKNGNRLLNMATATHTPGSSLKPIALYAPLINDGKINWATVFDDVPIEFKKTGNVYVEYPKNYPQIYDGLTNIKDALRQSKNTVAVRLYNMIGAENIYGSLKRDFGFDTLIRGGYNDKGNRITDLASSPLALGQLSYGVSLRKLTEAYTVFPSEGVLHEGRSFIAVYNESGDLILDNSPSEKEIYSKECARVMNMLLMNVTKSGTASAVTLKNFVDTAGKTGTSGDDKDRLFVGYTPYLTAGIWCGYRSGGESIGYVSPSHIKIWDSVMSEIHLELLSGYSDEEIENFSTQGLKKMEYCKDSGKLYCPDCMKDPRGSRFESGYFIPSCVPEGICDRHVLCKYDFITEGVATDMCPDDYITEISLIKVDGRHFPKEIFVTDAEYVYFEVPDDKELPNDYDIPYFQYLIPEGDFVGKGRRKKQFNSICYLHDN